MVTRLSLAATVVLAVVTSGCGAQGHVNAPIKRPTAAQRLASAEKPPPMVCSSFGGCKAVNRVIEGWLRQGRIPARDAVGGLALWDTGCLNCHRYRSRGGAALGARDLTHVGRRMNRARIIALLKCPACVEPGSPMPAFRALPKRLLDEIAAFLAVSR